MDKEEAEIIANIQKDISKLFIRTWIQKKIPNYKDYETYVIYDKKRVEKFNASLFNLNKRLRHFRSYHISYPEPFYFY